MTTYEQFNKELDEYRKTWVPRNYEQVIPMETFWVKHQKWLESCGYMLRPRYHPDWVPSWKGTDKSLALCEDADFRLRNMLMDATRISDGVTICFKMVWMHKHPDEVRIHRSFSPDNKVPDPPNHCVPLYDVLKVPGFEGLVLLVMPYLRPCLNPEFLTMGEALEFFRQVFEGIQFMHRHSIAHRDCNVSNIMMDGTDLYPDGYHPIRIDLAKDYHGVAKHYTRTERPPRYYIIDFGLSREYRFDPETEEPRDLPQIGGDKTVPEFQGEGYNQLCDPYAVDIYYLGNMIREEFLKKYEGFAFMEDLVYEMTQDNHDARPTIDELVDKFNSVFYNATTSHLKSRLVDRNEKWYTRLILDTINFFRDLRYRVRNIPPVPKSKPIQS